MINLSQASNVTPPDKVPFAANAIETPLGLTAEVTFPFSTYQHEGRQLRSAAGQGISAIFTNGLPDLKRSDQIQLLSIDVVHASPFNPRQFVNREAMASTYASVASGGLRTPLEVSIRPSGDGVYVLSGHRRLWIVHALNLDLVPCKIDPRGILSELQMREALINYNEGQERPALIDRAQSISDYIAASGCSQRDAAAKLNISPVAVSRMLKLLSLPEVTKELINRGKIPESTAFQLTRHPGSEADKIKMTRDIIEQGLSARTVERTIGRMLSASGIKSSKRVRPERKTHEVSVELKGAVPIRVELSSKADLTPERVTRALHEAIMRHPVEMEVHHQSGHASAPDRTHENGQPTQLAGGQTKSSAQSDSAQKEHSIETASDLSRSTFTAGQAVGGSAHSRMPALRSAAAESVSALYLGGHPDWERTDCIQLIHVENLIPHPLNPRKLVSREQMETTLASIRLDGIHTPLKISQHPEDAAKAYVMGGHRRLWCAREIGHDLVPCSLDPRGVLSEVQLRELLISDNEGLEKPAPVDRARAFQDYMKASGLKLSQVAERFSISPVTLQRILNLLELPKEVQTLINSGQINESVANAIYEHPGNSDIKRELAARAVRYSFTAAQVRRFAQNARITFDNLSSRENQNRTDIIVSTLSKSERVVVRLTADGKELSPREVVNTFQRVLEQNAASKNGLREPSPGSIVPVPEHLRSNFTNRSSEVVTIDDLPSRNGKDLHNALKLWMPKFVQEESNSSFISRKVAEVLQAELTNDELRKIGFTTSNATAYNTLMWHGIPIRNVSETYSVTLLQVLEYWHTTFQSVRSLPSSKKMLTENFVASFDVELSRGAVKRNEVEGPLRKRLKAFEDVFEKRMLSFSEARELEREGGITGQEREILLSMEELQGKGFTCPSFLRSYISRWKENELRTKDEGRGRSTFSLEELEAYYRYALRSFMDQTGGTTNHRGGIGRKQLSRLIIAYSGNEGSETAALFSRRKVLGELERNLEILGQIRRGAA